MVYMAGGDASRDITSLGKSGYISFAPSTVYQLSDEYTIEGWVRVDSLPLLGTAGIIGQFGSLMGYGLLATSTGGELHFAFNTFTDSGEVCMDNTVLC